MATNSVAVVGLGYVGLPLAIAFGKKIKAIGFDISEDRIISYGKSIDPFAEISRKDFKQAVHLSFTNDPAAIKETDMVIIAVPTPITANKQPDLRHIVSASEIVGKNLKHGAIVVYESTVYPGVTEDICCPILEKASGLQCGKGFKVGYSPERINPGDREHSLNKIVKVVAAQDQDTLEEVASTYELIVDAGVYRAESIKVAEAAKVIENTQRDLNIALMNELAIIFNRLGIDTQSVLEAACTKWNFLSFIPGLVGGHCIGVDPYYLTYCAQQVGYHPEVILAGRRINDSMGSYVAQRTVKELIHARVRVEGARVVILGLTFKENCSDIRNTRVVDIIHELREYGIEPLVHDPMADPQEAEFVYGIRLLKDLPANVDAVILAVAHKTYAEAGVSVIKDMLTPDRGVVIDVKDFYHPDDFNEKAIRYWRL
ncbi:MAG: nucleotide sugar dehydrogenase [Deltaproteobacteria bacterium]|nr:nucleotide sugar dehydrogenase [Deltaproteobacteria bacterium]MDL1962020.1 nucleotide sugar dehydrogenase [Deltaproteobacteria bacterium]